MARDKELPLGIGGLCYPRWQYVSERSGFNWRWASARSVADDANYGGTVADVIVKPAQQGIGAKAEPEIFLYHHEQFS